MSFCDAAVRSGFEMVAEAIGLGAALANADLVITGEGRIDEGTAGGKGPIGVAGMARQAGKPVVAVCGSADPGCEAFSVFDAVVPLVGEGEDASVAMAEPAGAIKNAVAQALPMLKELAQ
jgi:glycerate kinase